MAHKALIIGASKGLGASLLNKYASRPNSFAYGTIRGTSQPSNADKNTEFIPSIDVANKDAGSQLASSLKGQKIDTAYIVAGYFGLESFDKPDWDAQLKMYTISAIGPVFLVHHLVKSGVLSQGSKVVLITSEGGSIALRHESEGGGNYGHHASKAAENMVGKLLALDLKDKGVGVVMVHPGFMRTEMTKGVGFDKFWDEAGAKTPDQAAETILGFVEEGKWDSGTFWAVGGGKDVGTAEVVMGKESQVTTPIQLPW